jgi:flagellar biosynthesis GTPase FlhF
MANNLLMVFKFDADTIASLSLIVSIVGAVAAIFAAFYSRKAATKNDLAGVEQNTQYVEHFSNKILSIDAPIHPQEKQEVSEAQAHQEPSQLQAERKISPAHQETSQVQAQEEASPAQVERKASQTQREHSPVQSQQEPSQVQTQREASQAQPQRISISVQGEALGEVPLELFLTLQDASVRVSRVETLSKVGKTLGSSPCKATDNALVFKSILAPKKVRQWWDEGESTSEGEGGSVLRVYLLDESGREVYRDMPVSLVEGLRNVGIATLVVWTIKGSI